MTQDDKINGKTVAEWRDYLDQPSITITKNMPRMFLNAIEARDKELAEAKVQRDAMRAFILDALEYGWVRGKAREILSTTAPTPDCRALAEEILDVLQYSQS